MSTWAKGQPADSPAIPTILNGRLPDGKAYRARQLRLFDAGVFGYVPVTRIRSNDQIFPDFGRGALRTVALAGEVWGIGPAWHLIEVEHDPDIEPDRATDSMHHDPAERIFARRPDLDPKGEGLRDPVLELPADWDCDGNRIELPPPAARRERCSAFIRAIARARYLARQPRASVGATAVRPAPRAPEEIGLGSRSGDVDWLGRVRVITADADMGVWLDRDSPVSRRDRSS